MKTRHFTFGGIQFEVINKCCAVLSCAKSSKSNPSKLNTMTSDIKEKWGKIRSIGGMSPSKEKDAATNKWFEEGEFKDWLVKLEESLPQQVSYRTVLY